MNIKIREYDYELPDDRIAQYPLKERDGSKLLVYDSGQITSTLFRNLANYINPGTCLVFNNTRVIKARFLFCKDSGAKIEVFCIEPLTPSDYESSFASKSPVIWKCIIGNLKRWKEGKLCTYFSYNKRNARLCSEKIYGEGDTWSVRFSWDETALSFSEVIAAAGHVPLPPYINRNDEPEDSFRYQTVYSKIKGSVAAPTAGLHFTPAILDRLSEKGILKEEITLHVGAGTFQPVRNEDIYGHTMHTEHFVVSREALYGIIRNLGRIVAVGTTSVRTLESLYWAGIKVMNQPDISELTISVDQWEPYNGNMIVPAVESLKAIAGIMEKKHWKYLNASTKLMIIPGYSFRIIDGMITNFHQPRSTLLLLVSAWLGERWKEIYRYAMENDFRFLSYGDSSLLLR
jgi:S-adenosylmethionine:tRNA ribosyltransferase-isomerase